MLLRSKFWVLFLRPLSDSSDGAGRGQAAAFSTHGNSKCHFQPQILQSPEPMSPVYRMPSAGVDVRARVDNKRPEVSSRPPLRRKLF